MDLENTIREAFKRTRTYLNYPKGGRNNDWSEAHLDIERAIKEVSEQAGFNWFKRYCHKKLIEKIIREEIDRLI